MTVQGDRYENRIWGYTIWVNNADKMNERRALKKNETNECVAKEWPIIVRRQIERYIIFMNIFFVRRWQLSYDYYDQYQLYALKA